MSRLGRYDIVRISPHPRSRAVRAEYSEYGVWEDRRSFAFVARSFGPVPRFSVENGSVWCNATVPESGLRVCYRKTVPALSRPPAAAAHPPTPFVRHALSIAAGAAHWRAGATPRGNLGGTISDLSGSKGPVPLNCTNETDPSLTNSRGLPNYCTLGVASRDGWATYNDTFNTLLDDSDWATVRPLVDSLPSPWLRQEDTYVFVYGDDFLGATEALAATSGAQPVPPRHMLGPGISRYWQYSASEYRDLVRYMQAHGLPLDTLNMDTGWHTNYCFLESPAGCKGEDHRPDKGYSGLFAWDQELFPDPAALGRWLRQLGLYSYLDVHQGAGVLPQVRVEPKCSRR